MVPGAGLEPARPLSRGILSPLCLPIPPPGQYIAKFWRLRSESNRRPRLCRPLHNHSATQPESYFISMITKNWSGKPGTNRRPIPWQGIALPTELFPQILFILIFGNLWFGCAVFIKDAYCSRRYYCVNHNTKILLVVIFLFWVMQEEDIQSLKVKL